MFKLKITPSLGFTRSFSSSEIFLIAQLIVVTFLLQVPTEVESSPFGYSDFDTTYTCATLILEKTDNVPEPLKLMTNVNATNATMELIKSFKNNDKLTGMALVHLEKADYAVKICQQANTADSTLNCSMIDIRRNGTKVEFPIHFLTSVKCIQVDGCSKNENCKGPLPANECATWTSDTSSRCSENDQTLRENTTEYVEYFENGYLSIRPGFAVIVRRTKENGHRSCIVKNSMELNEEMCSLMCVSEKLGDEIERENCSEEKGLKKSESWKPEGCALTKKIIIKNYL